MTDSEVIREAMNKAADLMIELPPTQRGRWLVYLLEVLDYKASDNGQADAHTKTLTGLRDDISTRLRWGKW